MTTLRFGALRGSTVSDGRSSGLEGSGKSHFPLTGPDPIVYFDVDIGTEGVVNKFQQAGKQVLIYSIRIPKQESQEVYAAMWKDLKTRIKKAYTIQHGTVIWDTCSEIFELARLAAFGKLTQVQPHNYSQVNSEWRDLLRDAFDSSANTVFIHKLKPHWEDKTDNQGRLKSIKTKDYDLSGFAEIGYLAQVSIRHTREDTDAGSVFRVEVTKCRPNTGLTGTVLTSQPVPAGSPVLEDPLCNFSMLLNLVLGE